MAQNKKPNNGGKPNHPNRQPNRGNQKGQNAGPRQSAQNSRASGKPIPNPNGQKIPAAPASQKNGPVSRVAPANGRPVTSQRLSSQPGKKPVPKKPQGLDHLPPPSAVGLPPRTNQVDKRALRKQEKEEKKRQKELLRQKEREERIVVAEDEPEKKPVKKPEVVPENKPQTDYLSEEMDTDEVRRSHMAKKRKRDSLRAAFNVFLCVAILIGVFCIAVLYVVDYVAAKPAYAFATKGTIEHTIGAKALLIRNEKVIKSSYTGSLLTQATEGSRVAKDQLLAMVIPDGMESTVNELRSVERQIVDIERTLMEAGKGAGAKAIFNDINNEISPIISTVRNDAILGNLSNMTSYSSSIRVLMEKRDLDIEKIDFQSEELQTLKDSQETLKSQLENQAASVKVGKEDDPGIVSFKLDGHEDLNLDTIMNMMDYQVSDLIKKSNSIITGDLSIKKDEPVLRIVQNDAQYLACMIPGAILADFSVNSEHVIRVPSEGIAITGCKVLRSSYATDGLFVIFSTNSQVERLLDRRTVEIEIVQTKKTGIRIPITALVDPDYDKKIAMILINDSGYARGFMVWIEDYDREYAIVSPITEGSEPKLSSIVITNPHTVKDGHKVE